MCHQHGQLSQRVLWSATSFFLRFIVHDAYRNLCRPVVSLQLLLSTWAQKHSFIEHASREGTSTQNWSVVRVSSTSSTTSTFFPLT